MNYFQEEEQKLREYAAIKAKIRELEAQLDELKPVIMDMDFQDSAIFTNFGTFVLKEKRTYEYPEDIVKKETELKYMKKTYEASDNPVIKNITAFLTFIPKGATE